MSFIEEISEKEFNEKVIEASENVLVLTDFWAPWCGPCKQLTPLLEKIINDAKGKVLLKKINIDENQNIAAQLRIQSIPMVYAFKEKKVLDAFQGVMPENKIVEFIEKCLGEKLNKDYSDFFKEIENFIDEDENEKAIDVLENFLAENPEEYKAIGLYLNCLTNLKRYDDSKEFIKSLSKESLSNTYIKSAIQKLEIKQKNIGGPSIDELKIKLENNSKDYNNIINLADKYFSENLLDEAFELLLKNYSINKDEIKKKIIEFFEALGNENIKTIEYRKKFSSILFS